MRDINIALAWHNTNRTLEHVAKEFKVTKERVRQIHSRVVRIVLGYIGIKGYDFISKKDHSIEVTKALKKYKQFLKNNGF